VIDRARILNADFDRLTLDQSVNVIVEHLRAGERGWLCTVNVAVLMMMREDPFLQSFVDRAAFVVADGQPLIWVAPIFGASLPARVTGVDLVYALSRRAAREQLSVGLLGATARIVDAVGERLTEMYPELRICYTGDGYFSEHEAAGRAEEIRAAGTDILFVGMGVPRQEQFIDQQWGRLGTKLAIGVGGSFDVLAGLRVRAPEILQRSGMEWAFRLAQEPRRLWRRYLVTNSRFIYLIGQRLAQRRNR
jgi:N-acetylglucosaminyldiphosphoundecaprenol N-acetyl-beta-D-mannosaminyltransferase